MMESWIYWQFAFDMLVLATGAVIVARIRDLRRAKYLQHEQLASLRSDIAALSIGAVKVGEQIDRIARKLQLTNERQDDLELREPVEQSYGHAVRLANNGADIDDLMRNCGLVREEAELILSVRKLKKTA